MRILIMQGKKQKNKKNAGSPASPTPPSFPKLCSATLPMNHETLSGQGKVIACDSGNVTTYVQDPMLDFCVRALPPLVIVAH